MGFGLKAILEKGAALGLCLTLGATLPAYAQVAGADQGIFNDEEQMLRINNSQVQQYEQQKETAERDLAAEEQKTAPYRLYVQQKVQELQKGATAPGAKGKADASQLGVFQDWLRKDNEYKAKQQAYISQLQSTITNLQKGQNNTLANLQSDIGAMRETVQDRKDSEKFNQMMQTNYFNELQSEMGAASWGRPPTDGTFNSTGGYGMMGGYGMGMMGRQNGPGGRWW